MSSENNFYHLLGIKGLSQSHIQTIFETADNFKSLLNSPVKKTPALRDITIANLFFENSTRTRVSFELAEKRLGADIVNFSSSSSSVKKGETLIDTVNNILSMKVDMVVMRHPAPGACMFLAKHVDAQIVNAGDGTHEHPTQALLDAYSIREKFGDVAGCMVTEGTVKRNSPIRVLRDNVVIYEGELESLRRFKDDMAEVKNGYECGIAVKNYNDVRPGDQIEVYEVVEIQRTL